MEKIIKYYASLDNGSCIFDTGYFDTADALEWASGRGGKYGVGLEKVVNGEHQYNSLVLRADHRGRNTTFFAQEIVGWRKVSVEEIVSMI